jgi:hypothetical protein
MSWQTGQTRHAAGVVPPHVHAPGDPSDLLSDLPSDLLSAGPRDGVSEAPDRLRCESRSTSSAASSATLPRREAPSRRADPVPAAGSG